MLELEVIVLEDEHTSLVLVAATVIGSREDCDDVREAILGTPTVHLEAFLLDLMAAEYAEKPVLAQQVLHWLFTEII